MKRFMQLIIASLTIGMPLTGIAYEPATHRDLSEAAAQKSVLVVPSGVVNTTLLQDLGLKAYGDQTQLFSDAQDDTAVEAI